jgi:hypothetical protein
MAIQTQILDQESTNAWKKIYETTIGNDNLLTNGNFELWTAGTDVAPDGWTLTGTGATVARESTTIKLGTYSVKLTSFENNFVRLYKSIHELKGINYWKGKTVTFGCWVYASNANRAQLQLYDDVNGDVSSYHTGDSTWQYLTVTRTIDVNATYVRCALYFFHISAISVYFDGAIAVEGTSIASSTDLNNWEQTSLTISDLDGNTDEEYRLIIRVVNGYTGNITVNLRPNNDTGTNYGYQYLYAENADAFAGRSTSTSMRLNMSNNDVRYLGMCEVILYAKSGYVRTLIDTETSNINATTVGVVALWGHVWNNTADNITSLVIYSSGTNGLGVGTVIELYKKI